jgi:hypothetical protein
MNIHSRNKNLVQKFRAALYDLEPTNLKQKLSEIFVPEARIQLAFPFENIAGPAAFFEEVYQPLLMAIPDLERRDYIVMGGAGDGSGLLVIGLVVLVFTQVCLKTLG